MYKIITKTALQTLAILLALFIALFAIISLAIPAQVATWFEQSGNYSMAVKFADLQYGFSNEVTDLSRVVEDSIYSGDSGTIIKYAERLVEHNQFETLCEEKDEFYSNGDFSEYTSDYKQFICGNLAVAYAKTESKDKALECAYSANGETSFKKSNALIALSLYVAEQGDSEFARNITAKLNLILPNLSVESEDYEIIKDFIKILSAV